MKIIVKKGQSVLDVATIYYGSVEGVFDLMKRNNLKGMTANIFEGDSLAIGDPINVRLATILPKTLATIASENRAQGIGFMVINKNFTVG